MPHDVIGLDLGSSEVRAVVVRMAMRGAEVVKLGSEPVPLNENGHSEKGAVMAAAERLMEKLKAGPEDNVYCAAAGELVSVRRVVLPLSALKRLEQVVKYELDEVVPFDINDSVFDFVEIGREGGKVSVVSAAMLTKQAAELLKRLEERKIVPRELGVAALSYKRAYLGKKGSVDDIPMIVDFGHERTHIAILDPLVPTVRTVLRGSRELTERLARTKGMDFAKAEERKRWDGLSSDTGEVLRESLRPIFREIQQTAKGHLASSGKPVKRIVLCGGGALLRGLDRHVAIEMGVPVERYSPMLDAPGGRLTPEEASAFAMAHALAMSETAPKPSRINFRRKELVFKGDFEFLKRRIGWVSLCAVAVLFSWLFSRYTEYSVLAAEVETKKTALVENTKRVFGEPLTDYKVIAGKLTGSKIQDAPIPKKDAFDILAELSRRIPKSVVHDLELLEIKQKRVTMRGIVNAELTSNQSENTFGAMSDEDNLDLDLSPTDLIKEKLAEFKECFTDIRVGKVTSIDNRRRYQMDIDSKCP